MTVPNREAIPNLFAVEPANREPQLLQFLMQTVFGGCFQWVLDAACEAVEWLISHEGSSPSPSVRYSAIEKHA